MPRRARYLLARDFPRRDEILAACALLAVLAQVLFAQLTIALAVAFCLITKVTRWRPSWLLLPAAAGVAWTAAAGPRAAAAGFTAGPDQVAGYLGGSGHQLSHVLHFPAAFAGLAAWLPRQFPLAILAGAAEAAPACWLAWLFSGERNVPPARPGLVTAARRAATVRAIRAGGVATRDGGCLGVVPGTGARVTLSWPEAAGGVAICGSAGQDVLTTSFQLVHAAVRRRKPVLAVDFTADPALPGRLAAVCAAAGAPLQVFGPSNAGQGRRAAAAGPAGGWARPACYEPFRHGDPGRRAALVAAMLSWNGPVRQYRRSCVAYLEDVFELLDAAPGDPRVPVLDEVIRLLDPPAMRARMTCVPGAYPRREALAERARVSVSLVTAQPAAVAGLVRPLRELRGSALGRWLRPSAGGPRAGDPAEIDLGRVVAGRSVALFRLGGPGRASRAEAMLTRLVCADLLAAGASLQGIGVGGDGLVWLAECGSLPRQPVRDMIARGPAAGLPVLAATTSAQVAADLAGLVNVVVAHRTGGAAADPFAGLAAEAGGLAALRDGEFFLAVKDPRRVVPRGLAVRAREGA